MSGRVPELLFDGRHVIEAGALFWESFWYYNFNNPATGNDEARTPFWKLLRAEGIPLLAGAGYNPSSKSLSHRIWLCKALMAM